MTIYGDRITNEKERDKGRSHSLSIICVRFNFPERLLLILFVCAEKNNTDDMCLDYGHCEEPSKK